MFFHSFSEKIGLGISCDSSAMQTIHMKCHVLFSLKMTEKIIFIVFCFCSNSLFFVVFFLFFCSLYKLKVFLVQKYYTAFGTFRGLK